MSINHHSVASLRMHLIKSSQGLTSFRGLKQLALCHGTPSLSPAMRLCQASPLIHPPQKAAEDVRQVPWDEHLLSLVERKLASSSVSTTEAFHILSTSTTTSLPTCSVHLLSPASSYSIEVIYPDGST